MSTPAGTYGGGGYGQGPYGGGSGRTARFSQATEDAYARLPDFYREADRDGVLKRWLSAIFDQVGEMRQLRERFALEPQVAGVPRPSGEQLSRNAAGLPVSGAWTAVPGIDGSVALQSTGPGDPYAEWALRLTGGVYRLDISYDAGPDTGMLRLEVDGMLWTSTVDTYSPTVTAARNTVAIARLELPRGFHTVRAHWTGAKRTASSGTAVRVVGFRLVNLEAQARDTSDLVDPNTADDAWMTWLAQLVGARLRAELTPTERRDAVRQAARLQAGSQEALVAAARTALSGNRSVALYPHSKVDGGLVMPGTPWDLTLVTNIGETPSGVGVLDAVRRLEAKPAGVALHHTVFTGTWATFHSKYPTWAAIHAQPTWAKLQEASL